MVLMTKLKLIFLVFLAGLAQPIYAQEIQDSIEEIEVSAWRYQTYNKRAKIQFDQIQTSFASDLNDLLQSELGIIQTQYGPGLLSNNLSRGLGARHHNILWNGISLQNSMNAVIDYSLVPINPFQNINLYKGASSHIHGSGSIGSLIDLSSQFLPSDFNTAIDFNVGSFNNYRFSVARRFISARWKFSINGYYKYAENEFPFNFNGERVNQKNAQQNIGGVNMHLKHISKIGNFDIAYWKQNAYREIPPSKTSIGINAKQYDEFNKYSLKWSSTIKRNHFYLQTSYSSDRLLYNDDTIVPSDSKVKRLQVDGEWSFNNELFNQFSIGFQSIFDHAYASVYVEDAQRTQHAIYTRQQFNIAKRFSLTFHQRLLLNNSSAPFIFGANLTYVWPSKSSLSIKGNRVYNLPGFNDLYWPGLGNIDLIPESGYTYEVGLNTFLSKQKNITIGFDLFWNDLDNWIIWLPNEQNIWRPQNARKINTYGIEMDLSHRLDLNKITVSNRVHYYYTRSRIKEQVGQTIDLRGKQRLYIPLHKLQHGLDITILKFTFKYTQSITSKRYTNQTNSNFLNAFYTADFKVKWEFKREGGLNASLFASVINIWNTDYELIPFFAMPGRQYSLKTIIKF